MTRALRNILLIGLACYVVTFATCAGIQHGARASKAR